MTPGQGKGTKQTKRMHGGGIGFKASAIARNKISDRLVLCLFDFKMALLEKTLEGVESTQIQCFFLEFKLQKKTISNLFLN